MAKFDLNAYENAQVAKKNVGQKTERKVGYFNSLKDNGDTAIVRFAYHTPNEFDIVTVHKVQVDSKNSKTGKIWRSVSCLRGPYDPIDNCPLCKSGVKLNRKIYVKMIEYVRDETGAIKPHAVVWERPAEGKNDFVKKLMSLIGAGYTDLTKYVFMIRRNGFKGSLETTYEVNPVNPDMYPSNIYVEDFSDFNGFNLVGHSYIERNYNDLSEYASTGIMPMPTNNATKTESSVGVTQSVPQNNYSQPQNVGGYTQSAQPSQTYAQPQVSTQPQNVANETSQSDTYTSPTGTVRPRRTTYTF